MTVQLYILLMLVAIVTSDKPIGYDGPGIGAYGDCYPQTHYHTHYRTEVVKVPVYKTVLSKQLVPQVIPTVIFSTIQKRNFQFVTETEVVTEYDTVTRVRHQPFVSTLERVFYTPEFRTQTVYATQRQPLLLTSNVLVTEYEPVPVVHTQVRTDYITITDPVTLVHKSHVVDERFVTITSTAVVYKDIQVTKAVAPLAPGVYDEVVLKTNRIVAYKPSYVTTTVYQTHYVTATNVERIPVYVTQVARGNCGGYSYNEPAVPFDIKGSGYSYPEPAVPFDIKRSGALANALGVGVPGLKSKRGAGRKGPIVLRASGVLLSSQPENAEDDDGGAAVEVESAEDPIF